MSERRAHLSTGADILRTISEEAYQRLRCAKVEGRCNQCVPEAVRSTGWLTMGDVRVAEGVEAAPHDTARYIAGVEDR